MKDLEKRILLLKASVSKMLSLVSESIDKAVTSLDELREDLAREVLRLDYTIDGVNREIERKVYEIIASEKLDQDELRYVVTMIKFANNLERIGDLSCNIAEKTLSIVESGLPFRMPKEMKNMFGIVLKMVHDSFRAFSSRDVERAMEIWKNDERVDELERSVRNFVAQNICNGMPPQLASIYVLVAKDLERIGDHVTNLCEEIVFIETGRELTDLLEVTGVGKDPDSGRRQGRQEGTQELPEC